MQYFLFGLATLLLFIVATRAFAAANPAALARQIRVTAGVTALATGGMLTLRGAAGFGMWIVALGAWLLWGAGGFSIPGFPKRGQPAPGQASRVVTDTLDVELDHETGRIRGRVLKGFFRERDLETLRPVELAHLWSDCRFADPASAQILEVYLDRLHPTWRDDMARTGDDAGDRRETGPRGERRMSRAEALDILGLADGAGTDDIRRAHRELMLKLHPDRGGSHTLAAQVNEAKDVLLDG